MALISDYSHVDYELLLSMMRNISPGQIRSIQVERTSQGVSNINVSFYWFDEDSDSINVDVEEDEDENTDDKLRRMGVIR